MKKIAVILLAAVFLAGCARIKEKVSGYYLSKARKTLSAQNPSETELAAAYADIDRSLSYRPSSRRALETLRLLTDKAYKSGFAGANDLEINILKRVLRASLYNWPVYAAAVNALSARGDLYALNGFAAKLEGVSSSTDTAQAYEISMALALCYASMAPWVEAEGYLNLNKDADALVEKAREYRRVRRRAEELRSVLARLDAADPALRKKVSGALLSSADAALGDLAGSREEAARIYAAADKLDSEPDFLRAAGLTVQGNSALVKKDYSRARALYQSALRNYPGFIDARKQLVEVDFQQGAGLALAGESLNAGKQLLYRAYEESDAVIEAALEAPNCLPFMKRDKFLADTYSIRAAVISAVSALEKGRLKNKMKLEKEFKAALDEAVRLNPQGKLARELLERYAKEGF
ncbi:MAG: hypothetical protein A2X28_06220 [Elusimicrobia bacterium GWA2_56_46]|nr:MAG: hypothetical protein A2X28_06220 [Elusimicrobia bacterium GWA2_56_46]OGR54626.1 MAG: hypothetical protein A2X39_02270 [Elusimicrobia bacterium GWC2_56_31]HBB66056.1 hypothetical protein [Elusimicrobiota bacterium]HBW23891.1 hypothetical protein [Elusimicrobiota bacterium]